MKLCDESIPLRISPRRLDVSGHRISNDVRNPAQCLSAWCWAATTEFLWSVHSITRGQEQIADTYLVEDCAHACSTRDSACDREEDMGKILRSEGLLGKDAGQSIGELVLAGHPVVLDVRDGGAGHFPVVSGWIRLGSREPRQEYAEVRDPAGGLLRFIDADILTTAYPGWGGSTRRFVVERSPTAPIVRPTMFPSAHRSQRAPQLEAPDLTRVAEDLLKQLRKSVDSTDGLADSATQLLEQFFSMTSRIPPLQGIDPAEVRLCGPVFVAKIKKFLEVPGIQLDATWAYGLYAQGVPFGWIELQKLEPSGWRLEALSFAVDSAGDRFVRAIEAALERLEQQDGDIAVVLQVPRLRESAMLLLGAARELSQHEAVPLSGAFTFLKDGAVGSLPRYMNSIAALELHRGSVAASVG